MGHMVCAKPQALYVLNPMHYIPWLTIQQALMDFIEPSLGLACAPLRETYEPPYVRCFSRLLPRLRSLHATLPMRFYFPLEVRLRAGSGFRIQGFDVILHPRLCCCMRCCRCGSTDHWRCSRGSVPGCRFRWFQGSVVMLCILRIAACNAASAVLLPGPRA